MPTKKPVVPQPFPSSTPTQDQTDPNYGLGPRFNSKLIDKLLKERSYIHATSDGGEEPKEEIDYDFEKAWARGKLKSSLVPSNPIFSGIDLDEYTKYTGHNINVTRDDIDELRAQNQGGWEKFGNDLAKGTTIAVTTALQPIALVSGAIEAIATGDAGKIINNEVSQSLLGLNNYLEKELPNYYTHEELDSKNPFHGFIPGTSGSANFWFDKVMKNLGYTAGAIGGGWGVNSLIYGIGKAAVIGEGVLSAEMIAKGVAGTSKYTWTNLAQLFTGAGVSAASEASIEGLQGANQVKEILIQDHIKKNGTYPTDIELQQINQVSNESGLIRASINMPILMASDILQFGNLLGGTRALRKAAIKSEANVLFKPLEGEVIEGGEALKLHELGKLPEGKFIPKPVSTIEKVVRTLARPISEMTEEQLQYATEKGTENYTRRKYDGEAVSWLTDLPQELGKGLVAAYGTKEGWDNGVLGGITGAIFGVGGFGMRKITGKGLSREVVKEKNEKRQLAADYLNESILSNDKYEDLYTKVVRGFTINRDLNKASSEGDTYKAKNLASDRVINEAIYATRAGKLDILLDKLNSVRNASKEELEKQLGVNYDGDNKGFSEYIDKLIDKVQEVSKITQTVELKYGGKGKDGKSLVSKDIKDTLIHAAATAKDADRRELELKSEISSKPKGADVISKRQEILDLDEKREYDTLLNKPNQDTQEEHDKKREDLLNEYNTLLHESSLKQNAQDHIEVLGKLEDLHNLYIRRKNFNNLYNQLENPEYAKKFAEKIQKEVVKEATDKINNYTSKIREGVLANNKDVKDEDIEAKYKLDYLLNKPYTTEVEKHNPYQDKTIKLDNDILNLAEKGNKEAVDYLKDLYDKKREIPKELESKFREILRKSGVDIPKTETDIKDENKQRSEEAKSIINHKAKINFEVNKSFTLTEPGKFPITVKAISVVSGDGTLSVEDAKGNLVNGKKGVSIYHLRENTATSTAHAGTQTEDETGISKEQQDLSESLTNSENLNTSSTSTKVEKEESELINGDKEDKEDTGKSFPTQSGVLMFKEYAFKFVKGVFTWLRDKSGNIQFESGRNTRINYKLINSPNGIKEGDKVIYRVVDVNTLSEQEFARNNNAILNSHAQTEKLKSGDSNRVNDIPLLPNGQPDYNSPLLKTIEIVHKDTGELIGYVQIPHFIDYSYYDHLSKEYSKLRNSKNPSELALASLAKELNKELQRNEDRKTSRETIIKTREEILKKSENGESVSGDITTKGPGKLLTLHTEEGKMRTWLNDDKENTNPFELFDSEKVNDRLVFGIHNGEGITLGIQEGVVTTDISKFGGKSGDPFIFIRSANREYYPVRVFTNRINRTTANKILDILSRKQHEELKSIVIALNDYVYSSFTRTELPSHVLNIGKDNGKLYVKVLGKTIYINENMNKEELLDYIQTLKYNLNAKKINSKEYQQELNDNKAITTNVFNGGTKEEPMFFGQTYVQITPNIEGLNNPEYDLTTEEPGDISVPDKDQEEFFNNITENEGVVEESSVLQSVENIEAKKADIERRRQEELKEHLKDIDFLNEAIKEDNGNKAIAAIIQATQEENAAKAYNEAGKIIGSPQFGKNPLDIAKLLVKEIEKITQKSTDKINAKYDAELAALEQPNNSTTSKPNNETNLESKKADIERRRPTSYINNSKDKKSSLETFRNEAKREWDGISVITGDRMQNLYAGIQLFVEAYSEHKELLDKFIKKENGNIGITNNNLSFVLNTLKKQGVTTESELANKINAKYDAELATLENQNQGIPFKLNPLPFSTTSQEAVEPEKFENRSDQAKWMKKNLPGFGLETLSDLRKIHGIQGVDAFGTFKNMIAYVTKNSPSTTEYHEAMEGILRYLLTDSEREEILNEASKKYGIPRSFDNDKTLPFKVGEEANQVNYSLKAISLITKNLDKVKKWWLQVQNPPVFWEKLQKDLGIPKEQIELFRNSEGNTIEEKLLDFTTKYNYTVEINTAKEPISDYGNTGTYIEGDYEFTKGSNNTYWKQHKSIFDDKVQITKEEYNSKYRGSQSTNQYGKPNKVNPQAMNLVASRGNPKEAEMYKAEDGWIYLEQDIIIPLITPSITNHAAFADKSHSVGHFRAYYNTITKEVHVQEVQSDLFQKGRDNPNLAFSYTDKFVSDYKRKVILDEKTDKYYAIDEQGKFLSEGYQTRQSALEWWEKKLDKETIQGKENSFLQLLNKDNNWVSFFVKSIIQDMAKQKVTEVQQEDVEAKVRELEKEGLLEIDCSGKLGFTKGGTWSIKK